MTPTSIAKPTHTHIYKNLALPKANTRGKHGCIGRRNTLFLLQPSLEKKLSEISVDETAVDEIISKHTDILPLKYQSCCYGDKQ